MIIKTRNNKYECCYFVFANALNYQQKIKTLYLRKEDNYE